MRARWRRELDQTEAKMSEGLKCQFRPDLFDLSRECGKPATHSFTNAYHEQKAICPDCVKGTFMKVKPLVPCLGKCGLLLLDEGRCASCFFDWLHPVPRASA